MKRKLDIRHLLKSEKVFWVLIQSEVIKDFRYINYKAFVVESIDVTAIENLIAGAAHRLLWL